MAHRPYPSVKRALAQVLRRRRPTPACHVGDRFTPQVYEVDEYRLSTRRLR